MTAAVVLIGIVAMIASYIAISSNITAEENERKLNEFLTSMDSHLLGIENELNKINRELAINEQAHGVLSMQIQELSKLSKTDELRKEVLHTKEKKK